MKQEYGSRKGKHLGRKASRKVRKREEELVEQMAELLPATRIASFCDGSEVALEQNSLGEEELMHWFERHNPGSQRREGQR